ncbi:MAG: hypothetical protein R6U00_10240 [Prochlorococcaceae cyanobacterium]
MTIAELLAGLEAISRDRPDRVLRLRGHLPAGGGEDPFELLIFRGFSSSVSHPTAFNPDQPALSEEARIEGADLLLGPLNPAAEQLLAQGQPVVSFLEPSTWL